MRLVPRLFLVPCFFSFIAQAKLSLRDLGTHELSPNISFQNVGYFDFYGPRDPLVRLKSPWRLRGRDVVGAPMQSYVAPQYLGNDELLLATVGRGIDIVQASTGKIKKSFPVEFGVASEPLVVGASLIFAGLDAQVRRIRMATFEEEWSAALPTESFGGISLGPDGFIFVTTGDDGLWALDEKTGKTIWTYRRPNPEAPIYWSLRGGAVPKYLEESGVVMAGFSDASVVALNAKTGKIVWERKFDRPQNASTALFKDADTTLAVSTKRGLAYLSLPGSDIVALKVKDGSTAWAIPGGGHVEPLLLETDLGDVLYVSSHDGKLQKINAETGSVIWSVDLGAKGIANRPVDIGMQHLALSTTHGGNVVVQMSDGKIVWQSGELTGTLAPLVFDGRRLFSISGRNRLNVRRIEF